MPISKYHTRSNCCGNDMHPTLTHIALVISISRTQTYQWKRGKEKFNVCTLQKWCIVQLKIVENKTALASIGYTYAMLLMRIKLPSPPPFPKLLSHIHVTSISAFQLAMRVHSTIFEQFYREGHTKLPDAKPLELVSCYSPLVKKSFVRQVGTKGNFHL